MPATSLRLLGPVRALPQVGLVHHDHVVQQLLVDARRRSVGSISYVPTSCPLLLKTGKLDHAAYTDALFVCFECDHT